MRAARAARRGPARRRRSRGRGEDEAEVRDDDVERAVLVRQVLGVAELEAHVEPRPARLPRAPSRASARRCRSRSRRARPRGSDRDRAGARGEVEHPLAGARPRAASTSSSRTGEKRAARRSYVPCLDLAQTTAPASAQRQSAYFRVVGDLFSEAAGRRLDASAPLAQRLRPATLDDFVGPGARGRRGARAAPRDRGGPRAVDDPLRAAGLGEDDARADRGADDRRRRSRSSRPSRRRWRRCARCWPRARERLGASGQRTILFLDEIHRFNKAQQDALLPGVEDGLLTLIGATTENPYYEVNSALLSRAQVYELESHSDEQLRDGACGAARPRSTSR